VKGWVYPATIPFPAEAVRPPLPTSAEVIAAERPAVQNAAAQLVADQIQAAAQPLMDRIAATKPRRVVFDEAKEG
jgi:hypothetical protein